MNIKKIFNATAPAFILACLALPTPVAHSQGGETPKAATQSWIPNHAYDLGTHFDPESLKTYLNEGLSDADLEAQEAATGLRKRAVQWFLDRRESMGRAQLAADERSVQQGRVRYNEEPEIGEAKITRIDGDYAVKITLNPETFPQAKKLHFIIFEMNSLEPDPKRLELIMKATHALGEMSDKELEDLRSKLEYYSKLKSDKAKRIKAKLIARFISRVSQHPERDEQEIRDYLVSGSAHLRQYLSRMVLEGPTQALGVHQDELRMAFYGGRDRSFTRVFSKKYWQTWWNAKKSAITWEGVTVGIVCGAAQAGITYMLQTDKINEMLGAGHEITSAFSPETIPMVVSAWALTYATVIGSINGFYTNIVYSGDLPRRIFWLSMFSAAFSTVYMGIWEPMTLLTMATWGHITTNTIGNQFAKDDIYLFGRIREDLRINQKKMRIPFTNRAFTMRTKVLDTNIPYMAQFFAKMSHFVGGLSKFYLIPLTMAIARMSNYGYLSYLKKSYEKEQATNPSGENEWILGQVNGHLHNIKDTLSIRSAIRHGKLLVERSRLRQKLKADPQDFKLQEQIEANHAAIAESTEKLPTLYSASKMKQSATSMLKKFGSFFLRKKGEAPTGIATGKGCPGAFTGQTKLPRPPSIQ